jgi:hypothetical protein
VVQQVLLPFLARLQGLFLLRLDQPHPLHRAGARKKMTAPPESRSKDRLECCAAPTW